MIWKVRYLVPMAGITCNVEADTAEDAVNEFHVRFTEGLRYCQRISQERLQPIMFARVSVTDESGYISEYICRSFRGFICAKGKAIGESIEDIARRLDWRFEPDLLLSEELKNVTPAYINNYGSWL